MTMAEPEDMDDIFRRMTEDLDLDVENLPEITVSSLTDFELVERFNAVKAELYDRDELLLPKTETGKDLQTQYHGYLLEMRKRKLM